MTSYDGIFSPLSSDYFDDGFLGIMFEISGSWSFGFWYYGWFDSCPWYLRYVCLIMHVNFIMSSCWWHVLMSLTWMLVSWLAYYDDTYLRQTRLLNLRFFLWDWFEVFFVLCLHHDVLIMQCLIFFPDGVLFEHMYASHNFFSRLTLDWWIYLSHPNGLNLSFIGYWHFRQNFSLYTQLDQLENLLVFFYPFLFSLINLVFFLQNNSLVHAYKFLFSWLQV